jgi:polyhydroxybutyrate depolymerase
MTSRSCARSSTGRPSGRARQRTGRSWPGYPTADPIAPIEGGYSRHRGPDGELRGRTLSLDETAGFWRSVDRCPPGPEDTKTSQEFDAAEEICRFARPLLASAPARRR